MRDQYLALFGDALNYIIFVYILISVVSTACFNLTQQLISLIGLGSTILINVITTYLKN